MPLPEFVSRRGNTLYYRRAFPQELWPITRQAPFAMSLRTADPKEALRARPAAEREYQARVDAARLRLAQLATQRPMSRADAHALAMRWFLDTLGEAERLSPPANEDALDKAVEAESEAIADAREALALGRDDPATIGGVNAVALARRIREEGRYIEDRAAEGELVSLLRRAAVALHEVCRARLLGNWSRPTDPLFAAAMDAPIERPEARPAAQPQAAAKTIADLETAFTSTRLTNLTPATRQGYVPVFRLLREVVGEGTLLTSLTHDDGQRLFEAVRGTPTNAQKSAELKGLSVQAAIDEARRRGLPTLSAKTINDRYMGNLGALFGFARQRGWMSINPVEGLRAREEVAAADKREPFGPRLAELFAAKPWSPNADGSGKPIHYWGPLLALFHGLRLGEVAGLQVGDIADESGDTIIQLRAGQRQLKTQSARRDIPLHPELVRLGFIEFVKERRERVRADELLFEGERAYARDQWGRGLGDWFTRKVKALGLKGRKLTMHSLRHDFRDALREAEIEAGLADYLMGHAQEGVGATYGSRRPSLARLKAAVAKVHYPGLILPSRADPSSR